MSKFATIELREFTGQCQPVNDVVMQNLGIERMGFCQACGHEIKNHVGVYNQDFGYKYVGSCCKVILCKPDAKQINPDAGSKFTDIKGRELIVLSESQVKIFGDSIYQHDSIIHSKYSDYTPTFNNQYNGAYYSVKYNDFYGSILSQLFETYKLTGCYTLTIKQYNCIVKFLS